MRIRQVVICLASCDVIFQIALWDLAIERDTEAAAEDGKLEDLPPQLLFIHQENNVSISQQIGYCYCNL